MDSGYPVDRSRRVRERAAMAALATMWAVAGWARWRLLPKSIPVHFGFNGQPDTWGPANQIFLMPALALGLYLALTVAVHFPQSFHYGVQVTEENRARLEATAIQMIGWLKVVLVWVLAVLVAFQVLSATQGTSSEIWMVVLLCFCAILGTVVWLLLALQRAG